MSEETEQQYDSTTGGKAPEADDTINANTGTDASSSASSDSAAKPSGDQQAATASEPESKGSEGETVTGQPLPTDRMIDAPKTSADAYGKGETPSTASQPLTPQQQAVIKQRQAELEYTEHSGGLVRHAFEAMAGGPQTEYKFNAKTGEMTSSRKPLTTGQIAMGIIAQVLGGMGAGANAKNPADAIGKGFEYGRQQVANRDQAAQQKQTDAWKLQVQTIQTNQHIHANAVLAGKQGYESGMMLVNSNKPYYTELQKVKGAIKDTMYGDELQAALASGKIKNGMDSAIPIGMEPQQKTDGTGQAEDENGVPQYRMKYAIVDPEKITSIPKETLDYLTEHKVAGSLFVKDGKPVDLPRDAQMRVHTILAAQAKVDELKLLTHATDNYTGENKDEPNTVSTKPAYNPIEPMNKAITGPLIAAAADHNKVDANLLSVVMNMESSGNPKAHSTLKDGTPGADGLMQLMPKMQKKYGVTDPFDPQQSINGGAHMLADLMEQYKGDVSKVLAAYNGGPGGVDNPKPETVAYVKKGMSLLGNLKTTTTTPPAGTTLKPWTDAQIGDLSEEDIAGFRKLGGTLAPFLDGESGKSTADKAAAAGKVSAEAVGHIKEMIESTDGKLKGQQFINEYASGQQIAHDVKKKVAETNAVSDAKKAIADPQVTSAAEALLRPGNLTTLKAIGGMAGGLRLSILTKARELAAERGQPFDEGLIEKRSTFVDKYEAPSGSAYKNRKSINNMIVHSADLADVNDQFRRTNVDVINTPINKIRKLYGDATFVKFRTPLAVLKEEADLYFAGGYAPTNSQKEMWDKIVSENAKPSEVEAFSKEILTLGLRRAATDDSEYEKMMGHVDPDMITPAAREAAQKLIGTDPKLPGYEEGQEIKRRLDKFGSGGQYGLEQNQIGYQPGQQSASKPQDQQGGQQQSSNNVVPKGAFPARDGKNNIIGYKTADGKVTIF